MQDLRLVIHHYGADGLKYNVPSPEQARIVMEFNGIRRVYRIVQSPNGPFLTVEATDEIDS